MQKATLTLLFVTLFASAQEGAQRLFEKHCVACHARSMPKSFSDISAPPIFGVMRHVKQRYAKKEDAVAFIVDYVLDPDRKKAVCKPEKIARFGLMPSLKGVVTPQELRQIASWLYDNYPGSSFRPSCQGKGHAHP